jgi:hypothetical protein
MSLSRGLSVISETIFENRFIHVSELKRMGADIRIDGNSAIIQGMERLSGTQVMATDLRASASLILSGLAADGVTEVSRVYHLDRGYDGLDKVAVGANIKVKGVNKSFEQERGFVNILPRWKKNDKDPLRRSCSIQRMLKKRDDSPSRSADGVRLSMNSSGEEEVKSSQENSKFLENLKKAAYRIRKFHHFQKRGHQMDTKSIRSKQIWEPLEK